MTAVHTDIGRNRIWEQPRHTWDSGLPVFIPADLPTEDDLPCDDGEPMETPRHRDQMNLLIESLEKYWNKSRRYYIGGNMFLHFEVNDEKKFRGPDVFLVTDVEDRERKSWVV